MLSTAAADGRVEDTMDPSRTHGKHTRPPAISAGSEDLLLMHGGFPSPLRSPVFLYHRPSTNSSSNRSTGRAGGDLGSAPRQRVCRFVETRDLPKPRRSASVEAAACRRRGGGSTSRLPGSAPCPRAASPSGPLEAFRAMFCQDECFLFGPPEYNYSICSC
jgi:hypothetical protein